ncbi:MAG: hypothetical protein A3E01_03080 [Gammaproteobacteria bacterium RIFCSPHIGHO2_12_FULL_63_22]|nr:MAG: hypothetical protein A3E01_03080 [Gammaproteobacteria bacterium RIFCSPHIGHO2_12_FULL_63_22]
MKSQEEIDRALVILVERAFTPGINGQQKSLILGMCNALAWVSESKHCSSIQDLLDGRPLAVPSQPNSGLN